MLFIPLPAYEKLLLLCLSVLAASCDTATRQFESRLDEIVSGHKAFVGVAIRTPRREDNRGETTPLLPMMSVFTSPVALAALTACSAKAHRFTQPISITPDLLLTRHIQPDARSSLPESEAR